MNRRAAHSFARLLAAPGGAGQVPVTEIKVKSLVARPRDGNVLDLAGARVEGAAWSGASPVARVVCPGDGGKTWSAARLGRDQSRYAWRLWKADWKPPARGACTLMARATDESGAAQPMEPEWNPPAIWGTRVPGAGGGRTRRFRRMFQLGA